MNSIDNALLLSSRIRWKRRLFFKPDESVDLYGGDDEEDEDEDSSLPEEEEEQEPDIEWMATFVINRLFRAYIRTKIKQMRDQQSQVKEEATDTTQSPDVVVVPDAQPASSELGQVETEEADPPPTTTEKVTVASVSDVIPDETDTKATEESTGEEEKDEADVLTAEVPSLMHEKEGDRNISLRDDFVESKPKVLVDGEGDTWSWIPAIPEEISLEFGRPLQVVKDSVPPISS